MRPEGCDRGGCEIPGAGAPIDFRVNAIAQPVVATGPLSSAQLGEIESARKRSRAIRRGVVFSRFNAWTLGFFALVSLMIAGFSLPQVGAATAVCAALIAVTAVEFVQGTRLKRFEPGAARLIAWNQMGLGAALAAYCAWKVWGLMHGQRVISTPELAELMGDEGVAMAQRMMVWGFVAAGGIVLGYQLLVGLWYLRLEKRVGRYREETPGWVVEVLRRG